MTDLTSGIFASVGLSLAITLIFTVATIIFVIFIFRRVFGGIKQQNQLLMTGEPAQATVLQLWDTGMKLNDNPQVGLLLEVRPANRQAYQVETKCFVSFLKLPQVQPGAIVHVKVDPADPTRVALALA